jgi:hypothetical protein
LALGVPITELPEEQPHVWDLSQAWTIGKVTRHNKKSSADAGEADGDVVAVCVKSGCITPKGIHFHTGRVRRLLGVEALHCQGLYFEREATFAQQYDKEEDSLLHDLAGNAFEGHCCVATALCLMTTLAKARARCRNINAMIGSGADKMYEPPELQSAEEIQVGSSFPCISTKHCCNG